MGIIKKQSIQSTIYNYIGVGLGFLNSAILLPLLLSEEQVGLLSFLNSFTSIMVGFCTLGVPLVTLKLFPRLRNNDRGHHGFFVYLLITTLIGCLSGLSIFFLFQDWLISESNTAKKFAPFAIGFSFILIFRVFSRNLDSYIKMLMNTVLGAFLENFLLKFVVFIALGVYWWVSGYDFVWLFVWYVLALSLPGMVSLCYVIWNRQASLDFSAFHKATTGLGKEILTLSVYGLLGVLGSLIILEIDTVMVGNLLGLEQTAVYKTAFFFGLFCSIPARALKRIAVVVVAEAWENNDIDTIKDIYTKSTTHLFLFGVYLFLGVWVCLDYVFLILPEAYSLGKWVVLIIGIAQLIDLVSGINTEIIASSPYYKYTTYFIAVLIVVSILSNYLLIPIYGIEGAALASLVSLLIYNLIKYYFLLKKLKYQPFNFQLVKISIIGIASWAVCTFVLPSIDNLYLGILMTGSVLTVAYWLPVYFLNISDEINETIHKILRIKN